jgi:hypothetical protein
MHSAAKSASNARRHGAAAILFLVANMAAGALMRRSLLLAAAARGVAALSATCSESAAACEACATSLVSCRFSQEIGVNTCACSLSPGGQALVAFATIAFVVLVTACLCYWCACCPWYQRRTARRGLPLLEREVRVRTSRAFPPFSERACVYVQRENEADFRRFDPRATLPAQPPSLGDGYQQLATH